MNAKQIEKILDGHFETYFQHVDRIAAQVFNTVVQPWLKENGYSFIAGNGDYFVSDASGQHIYNDDLPQHIQEILDAEIPGMPANSLGTLMPDYKTEG